MAAKAAWERQQAIDNTLRECAQLRAQQRFAEAIELVESTLRDYSSDPALVDLLAKLEEDWKGKRRADAVRKAKKPIRLPKCSASRLSMHNSLSGRLWLSIPESPFLRIS